LPEAIHAGGFPAVTIPMQPGARSLNLSVSVGILAAAAQARLGQ
jgi:tRNA(Leu) C34 or U34 (ribose-2'-O)-methylase TrmL